MNPIIQTLITRVKNDPASISGVDIQLLAEHYSHQELATLEEMRVKLKLEAKLSIIRIGATTEEQVRLSILYSVIVLAINKQKKRLKQD